MEKIQVIKYGCCGKIFAGCCEPECYIDRDWLKELKVYISKGCTVEMIDKATFAFEKCECVKVKKTLPQLMLF